jgi:hypothetical protein
VIGLDLILSPTQRNCEREGKVMHLYKVYCIVVYHSLSREGTMNAVGKELREILDTLLRLAT